MRIVSTQGTDVAGVGHKTNGFKYMAFGMQMESVHNAVRNVILY
jgi:hypothetical protein